jgi:ferric-dicitrate binding protein FerR (iron transport regulator)
MDERSKRRDMFELLDILCDGRMEPCQHERLQQLLKDDVAAQRIYLDYLDTHLALRRLLLAGNDGGSPPVDSTGCRRVEPTRQRGDRPQRRFRLAVFAVAAGVTIAATIVFALRGHGGRKQVERVAALDPTPRLIQSAGAKFFAGRSLPNGSRIPFGEEFALTDGILEIAFVDGATTIIRAPAVFEVANRARLIVKLGRCSIHAPEGAHGFRVQTPVAEVVDRGTRFSVDVSERGEAEVQVVEGLADVHPGASPHSRLGSVRLATGQAQKYSLDSEVTAREVRFDASKYTSRLPDRVVTYDAKGRDGGGAEELLSVSIQRDGMLHTYRVADLIGIDLIHYKTQYRESIATGTDAIDPEQGDPDGRRRRDLLDRDAKLTTGAINPGSSKDPLTSDPVLNDPEDPQVPNTPGFAVRFREPVINSPGPDVIIFDIQMIVHRPTGDPFHVSPLRFAPGLKTHTVQDYDIDLFSPEARTLAGIRVYPFRTKAHSMRDLSSGRHSAGRQTSGQTKALVTGIDLSDLGYKAGAAVEGLFFQSAPPEGDPDAVIDPVFLAGLPPLGRPIERAAFH